MVLIYAISGIVMNHRDTINPNFSITRKEYKIAEKLPDKAGMNKEKVLTLLEPLGEVLHLSGLRYRPLRPRQAERAFRETRETGAATGQ